VQTQFYSGQHQNLYDDSTLEVYMDTTSLADQYGLNLLDLLMSEVGVVLSSPIFSIYYVLESFGM